MIISKGNQPHLCVSAHHCKASDRFEVVDTTGHEHEVVAGRIPVTRRDGNAWTIVKLKSGALVALVEQLPPEAPESDDSEGEGSTENAQADSIDLSDTQPELKAAPASEDQ